MNNARGVKERDLPKKKTATRKMTRKATTRRTATKRDRAAAGERINKLAKGIVEVVHERRDPYVDIPSRTLSNVRFNEKTGIIELLDGKQRRSFFSLLGRRKGEGSQAKKFMQTIRVAEVCKRSSSTPATPPAFVTCSTT